LYGQDSFLLIVSPCILLLKNNQATLIGFRLAKDSGRNVFQREQNEIDIEVKLSKLLLKISLAISGFFY